jgi:prepilin-type N-terminal cleavage/methylation domain-containing protein
MKKQGFTLAEVLITLGIIGVVAALTLPSLISNTADAEIGPKLAKAVSMFEQANGNLLNEYDSDNLLDTGLIVPNTAPTDYMEALSHHLKIYPYQGTTSYSFPSEGGFGTVNIQRSTGFCWQTKDGMIYFVSPWNNNVQGTVPYKQRIGVVFIDITGPAQPNLTGSDGFGFSLMNDGTLIPIGSTSGLGYMTDYPWTSQCPNNATPTTYISCTASIFENNYKVLYKMR